MTELSGTDLSVKRATVGNRLLISDVDSCVSVRMSDVPRLIAVLCRLYRATRDGVSESVVSDTDSDGGATTESVSPERAFRLGFQAAFESEHGSD